jgi:hypothetical protein
MNRDVMITFKTTKDIKEEARRLSLIDSRTMSQVVDFALREFINKRRKQEEKKAVSNG